MAHSHRLVADVLVQQGKLEEGLKGYRAGHAISERLALADRGNTDRQRDLAVSHSELARISEKLGDGTQALAELRHGRDIVAGLVTHAPDSMQWKGDLAWFDRQIGCLEALGRTR